MIEAFNSRLCEECLNDEIFDSLGHARRALSNWRYDYSHVRPHSTHGGLSSAIARRALELLEGSASGALANTPEPDYKTLGRTPCSWVLRGSGAQTSSPPQPPGKSRNILIARLRRSQLPTGANLAPNLSGLAMASSAPSDETLRRLEDALDQTGIGGSVALSRAMKAIEATPKHPSALERRQNPSGELLHRMGEALVDLDLLTADSWAETLCRFHRLPRTPRKMLVQGKRLDAEISASFLRRAKAVPVQPVENAPGIDATTAHVAIAEPGDTFVLSALRVALGRNFSVGVAPAVEIDAAIERLYAAEQEQSEASGDVARLIARADDGPVVRYVNELVTRSDSENASDIHFEPKEDGLDVRIRIDGVLRAVDPPPADLVTPVISRLKIMAGLDIAERRRPQDGRAKVTLAGRDNRGRVREVDLRVATSPALHGETIVLRLLKREAAAPKLEDLGADASIIQRIERLLLRRNGLILVTGPTGSGKTTSLYAMIGRLRSPDRKIITVEDPIEYEISGLTQIQVKSDIGLDFANALRSLVRQNPDVVLVGETRDAETAKMVIQTALTGHLVLSSLHTNDAATAVARLTEIGAEPYAIASTLNAVIAQRLVRRLCPDCREPATLDVQLAQQLGLFSAATQRGSEAQCYHGVGCSTCGGSGFSGRRAVFEMVEIDETMRDLVMRRAPAAEIREAARVAGAPSLLDGALELVLDGETSLEEVARTIGTMD